MFITRAMRQVDWAAAEHILSPFSSPFFTMGSAVPSQNTGVWRLLDEQNRGVEGKDL